MSTVKTSLSLTCTFVSKIGHPPHSVDGQLGSSHAFVLWLLADRVLQIPYICKDNGLKYHRLFFTLPPEYFIVYTYSIHCAYFATIINWFYGPLTILSRRTQFSPLCWLSLKGWNPIFKTLTIHWTDNSNEHSSQCLHFTLLFFK